MSAFEQIYLEQEAASRLRDARDFVARERLLRDGGRPARARGQALRWAVLVLAVAGMAFVVYLV